VAAEATGTAPGHHGGPEIATILAAAAAELAAGRDIVLATVVSTRGSTYRQPGARLLVRQDATSVGLVSGGCLESEVVEAAREVATTGSDRLVTYDLTADEEAIWGWGLGCNGAIDVLVQSPRTSRAVIEALGTGQASGRPHVLATVVTGAAAGEQVLVLESGRVAPEGGRGAGDVVAAARRQLGRGRSRRLEVAGEDVFLEVIRPPLTLVICGAGEDAAPLVRSGAQLGWSVVVVDDRRARLVEDRFPEATRLVHAPASRLGEVVVLDDLTYVVVMSHDFLRDATFLEALAGAESPYIGLLGPARRRERLREQLERTGVAAAVAWEKVYGPAGLDLGAEGPQEIAWSICAEILAVSRGRAPRHLRDVGGSGGRP
jgi:xanthine dehydrogenase accessory factor